MICPLKFGKGISVIDEECASQCAWFVGGRCSHAVIADFVSGMRKPSVVIYRTEREGGGYDDTFCARAYMGEEGGTEKPDFPLWRIVNDSGESCVVDEEGNVV